MGSLIVRHYTNSTYQGLPNLTDESSFRVKEAANHWRQQLTLAVTAGKTVFIYLPALKKVWVDSGRREYSGTGRNRQTTRVVEPFDNYRFLPSLGAEVLPSEGRQMKLTTSGEPLMPYWAEFGEQSLYKIVLRNPQIPPSIVTSTGDLAVGCTFTFEGAKGRFVALPPLATFDIDPEEAPSNWTKAHKQVGHKLLQELLVIHRNLTTKGLPTAPPEWASQEQFRIPTEAPIQAAILDLNTQVDAAIKRKGELLASLEEEGRLRALLYGSGKELESAILAALELIGFTAEGVRNDDSEFDAVFTSPEGRFLGEAEGKDNKAINIDKLRQLEMNIQEDFQREGVTSFAKPVLFGNAYRLQEPTQRPAQFFTEKCLTAAMRAGAALVRTTDLFVVAQYLRGADDTEYAEACRQALVAGAGDVVLFPAPPPPGASAGSPPDNTANAG
jgi:hypothetical protein